MKRTAVDPRRTTLRLVLDALFAALYVIFAVYLTVKTPVTELSLSTLPLLLSGFLFGPGDAVLIAAVGSFIEQLCFGLSPTAPIWMLPPILAALAAGLLGFPIRAVSARRMGRVRTDRAVLAVVSTLLVELLCTVANTAALYLDGHICGYSVAALSLLLLPRLINLGLRAAVSCIVVPLLLPRIQKLMSKRSLS